MSADVLSVTPTSADSRTREEPAPRWAQAPRRACSQALGRLPWLALFFLRPRRLRPLFAMTTPLEDDLQGYTTAGAAGFGRACFAGPRPVRMPIRTSCAMPAASRMSPGL